MSYTVIWLTPAIQALAAIWMAAPDRNAVTRAVAVIDQLLAAAPDAVGVFSFDTVRELSLPPLGVEYEINDADQVVLVLACWDTATGRPDPTGN